jgi:hypothetical protein
MKTILTTLLILSAAGAVAQMPAPSAPLLAETVTVQGTGRSNVAPDRFTFSVGVQTVAPTVDDAVSQNNTRVANVIAALKKAGAKDTDIQTSQFHIWPQQDYRENQLPRILGYQVSNNVTVRSTKIADAGRLLGIAIGAGVNTSSGINFEVSDPARGRDAGLRSAFEDARAKATLLAQAAGRSIGRVIIINEGVERSPQPYPVATRAMAMEARVANADVPVESGTTELTFQITATFELR